MLQGINPKEVLLMSDGLCIRFNNATQRVFGAVVSPIVYAWQTNDPLNPWYAEARLVRGDDVLRRFAQASAPTKKRAKDLAASWGYQWLQAQYPNIDLTNI